MESGKKIVVGMVIAGIVLAGFFFLKDSKVSGGVNALGFSELGSQDVKGSDTGRYFLSEVELTENMYTPTITRCFFDEQGEVYRQWSAVYHPSDPPYRVVLVRVELLENTSLNETCFIKEIATEEDWEEVEARYGFSREKFGR